MIEEAFAALVSGDYARSQELLGGISKQLPASSKSRGTAHNAAVVALYAAGGASKERIEEVVRCALANRPENSDSEDVWALCDNGGLGVLYQACGGVHLYNLGVIAYNSGRTYTALNIGVALYDNIEAMEDWLALRVALLLVDTQLKVGDTQHAAVALRYAERILPQFKNHTNKKLFPVAPEWKKKSNAVLQPPISYEDARFFIATYKDRIRAVGGNQSGEKQTDDDGNSDAKDERAAVRQLIEARIEVDDAKILGILEKFKVDASPDVFKKVAPIFFNTLGVVHHRLGLHAVACCYFERSRAEFLNANSSDKKAYDSRVAYNLGLHYMKLEEYKEALGMFSLCAKTNEVLATTSPHLWIRMTECCVAEANKHVMYSQGVKLEGCGRGRRLELRSRELIGKGKRLFSYATICARTCLNILGQKKAADETNNDSDSKLRAVALAMLAYSMLEVDAKAALAACNELVDVSSGIDYERAVLGRLYGAEALCMLGRPNDAVERLAPLLAMRASAHAGIRDGAFVNVALAHSMRGDMATAVRAAKAALKVTAGTPSAGNSNSKASYRREALLVATYVFLREGDLANARSSLHSLRTIPVPKHDDEAKEDPNQTTASTETKAQKEQAEVQQ